MEDLAPFDTIVSYFDLKYGPSILVSNSDIAKDKELEKEISALMDLHQPDSFFVHYHNNRISANYIYSFLSEAYVRGGHNEIMISFVFNNSDRTSGEFLRYFFSNIKNYENQLKILTKWLHKKVEFKNLLAHIQNPRQDTMDLISYSKLQLLKMLQYK
ncbi:MAG: hypothetical protein JW776_16055 [Candidatus Lokiarchaeota archaeon]|nr:hypothetical protein [Candidatus Lokiarchaeota archaeon]